jgi:uncharacterized repeat protein (TIGR03803 family)
MAGRGTSGLRRRIVVGWAPAKMLRFLFASTLLLLAGRTLNTCGQTVTILYSFTGPPDDGAAPQAALVQASDGSFYGTTVVGGTSTNCNGTGGCGTVFRISPSGTHTTLYSFVGSPNDGWWPNSGLVQANDGNFYGTTLRGGTYGYGTVFRISPSGTYTNLHSFFPLDDGSPYGKLVQAGDGNLYGTTAGANTPGAGCFYRISPSGDYTNLYSFGIGPVPTNGCSPLGVVLRSDGNFYGSTELGGTNGHGTIFRISPAGIITNLHLFGVSAKDGSNPWAGLVQGSDGNFYGTTVGGGTNEFGTVFRISPSGSYTSLYSFVGFPKDGANPSAGLAQGSDGNFYGTTTYGGTSGSGTVFRISPGGAYTSLYSFESSPYDGVQPLAGLVQGSDGNLYGTTPAGGTSTNCSGGCGTVYKLMVPLSPPPYPINQITGVQMSGADMVFNVVSIACETYQLQFTTDLASGVWSNVPGVSVTNSIGALLTLTNSGGAAGPQGFYRFAITP